MNNAIYKNLPMEQKPEKNKQLSTRMKSFNQCSVAIFKKIYFSDQPTQQAVPTFQYLMKHFVILAVIEDHYGKTNIYANANI